MRRVFFVVLTVIVLLLMTIPPASAQRGCVLDILGIKVCGELLTPLPTITVTLPPVKTTVQVPGPTTRITIPGAPGQTETVKVPGPTSTKTVHAQHQHHTVTTKTKTVRVSPTGQPSPTRGTLGPRDVTEHQPLITLKTPGGVVRTVGIGLFSILIILAIVLAGMYYGFSMGRRSQRDEDTNFMREVLDSVKSRGKHS